MTAFGIRAQRYMTATARPAVIDTNLFTFKESNEERKDTGIICPLGHLRKSGINSMLSGFRVNFSVHYFYLAEIRKVGNLAGTMCPVQI